MEQKLKALPSLFRLLKLSRRYMFYFICGVVATLLVSVVDSSATWFLKPLMDEGLVKKNTQFIVWLPLIFLLICIVRGAASTGSNYFLSSYGRNVVMFFRQQLFKIYMKLPLEYFDNKNSAHLVSTVIYNVDQVSAVCSSSLLTLLRETMLLVGLISVLFIVSWKLTLLFLLVGPPIVFALKFTSKRMRLLGHRVQTSMQTVTEALDSGLRGVQVIKMACMELKQSKKFDQIALDTRRQELKIVVTNAIGSGLVQVLVGVPLALVIFLAFKPQFVLSAGSFAAYVTAMMAIGRPVKRLTSINSTLQKGMAAVDSLFEHLDLTPEDDEGVHDCSRVKGLIKFKSVDFKYPASADLALDNINLVVQPGEMVAIVGFSGAGKTTLVNLLPRFYKNGEGRISIDDIEIEHYRLDILRKQFSYVSQTPFMFDDTISNNIKFGCDDVSVEKIEWALEQAYLLDFVRSLPQGLDTVVGQDGVKLSGGQRQRIVLARAFLKNAPILILDEATSALDSQSEKYIQNSLRNLMKGSTTLVIAHRLSTIESADRIVVMDKGRIIEQGTHEHLLSHEGVYAHLYNIQFGTTEAELSEQ
jgi:ATP-binding cassette, subfamily B, bacterial MsbA